jgi:hypothetical protein
VALFLVSFEVVAVAAEEEEEEEEDYFAETASAAVGEPLPSKQELPALTTTIEPLHSTPAYSLPGSVSMPNSLNFEIGGRQNNPYYTVSSQYTNTFSHPTLSTPMTSNMTSSQDTPVFEYSIQNPVLASISVHDQTGDPGYYGRRINTDSDQDTSVFEYSIQNPVLASTSVHDQVGDPDYYGRRDQYRE